MDARGPSDYRLAKAASVAAADEVPDAVTAVNVNLSLAARIRSSCWPLESLPIETIRVVSVSETVVRNWLPLDSVPTITSCLPSLESEQATLVKRDQPSYMRVHVLVPADDSETMKPLALDDDRASKIDKEGCRPCSLKFSEPVITPVSLMTTEDVLPVAVG